MKIKRWISVLLCMLLCVGMLPVMAMAAENTEGRFVEENGTTYFYQNVTSNLPNAQSGFNYEFKYELNEDYTASLIVANAINSAHYEGAEVTVLGTITYKGEDYTVTTVGEEAFRYSHVKIVHLPETITTIKPRAFIYCYYAEEINIPANVTSLGENAFWTCHALKEINIPKGITEIPNGAFNQCWGVTEFTIPTHVTTIGESAFAGLGHQSGEEISLIIPANVISIGYEAFGRTKAIKSVTVEANRTENLQLNGAFRVCDGLESVNILSENVTIGNNEFQACPALNNITFTEGMETIGNFAFSHSDNDASSEALSEAVIPSTVTSIGTRAFRNCRNAVVYYPASAVLGVGSLENTKTQVKYSVNDGESVTIDSVTGEALAKTPETIGGKKVSAVPNEYKPEDKHFHYFRTDEVYCSICGTLDPDHKHIFKKIDRTEATCTTAGKEAYYICETCNKYFEDEAGNTEITNLENYGVIAATGHDTTLTPEVEATCTTDGKEAYYTCETCGKNFEDEAGNMEITNLDEWGIIPAAGHKAGTEWKSDGTNHWNKCVGCGEKMNEAAHDFEWVIDKEATATEAGSRHEQCKICGYEKAAVEIPATGTTTDPTKPNKPDDTGKPADTTKPDGKTDSTSPQTGDNSNIALWIMVMLAVGAALIGTATYSRKRKYNR